MTSDYQSGASAMREMAAKIADKGSIRYRNGPNSPKGFDVLNRGRTNGSEETAGEIAKAIRASPLPVDPTSDALSPALTKSAVEFVSLLAADADKPVADIAKLTRECMDDLGVTPRRIDADPASGEGADEIRSIDEIVREVTEGFRSDVARIMAHVDNVRVPKLDRPEYCEPHRFLLLCSYCGDDDPDECSEERPCAACLNMCNTFGEDGKYIGTIDRETPYRAELDDAKARASSRQDQIDVLEDLVDTRDAEIATLRADADIDGPPDFATWRDAYEDLLVHSEADRAETATLRAALEKAERALKTAEKEFANINCLRINAILGRHNDSDLFELAKEFSGRGGADIRAALNPKAPTP